MSKLTSMPEPEHPMVKLTAGYQMMGKYVSFFCSGCGYGIIAQCLCRAFDKLKLDPIKFPKILGIGCHSLMAFIVPGPAMMVLHGRAIPIATGMKLANPEIKPIVITGDGDCLAIGTNHFVHAARRNVDMVVLITTNYIYGMTGGQVSPTTPFGSKTTTSVYGNAERSIDVVKLAKACGATYIARWTTAHPRQLTKAIMEAIQHKGFSVIEVVSQCVTYYGRFNNLRGAPAMYKWLKENSVRIDKVGGSEEMGNKIVVGKFLEEKNVPTLRERYEIIFEKVRKQVCKGE